MFDDKQTAALSAPLVKANVKKNPRGYSYVEGWKAIDEANRIFGFHGWDRELQSLKILGEPYKTGDNWRVGYMATVRITVDAGGDSVVRDGTGYGSGIGKDLNDCHESAAKEAETDAMKRALMTFGNPFGLALYDKEQTNVVETPAPAPAFITDDQRDIIAGLAQAAGTPLATICAGYKIDNLKALPASKYDKLVERLQGLIQTAERAAA